MGNMSPQHLGNAASEESILHQLRDMWKSPRGTVLRIEALALVAIALSFFLAAFGYCRRWSKSWIIQKGFLAANALFLSLGTYSAHWPNAIFTGEERDVPDMGGILTSSPLLRRLSCCVWA